jgi:hypothetical protein
MANKNLKCHTKILEDVYYKGKKGQILIVE